MRDAKLHIIGPQKIKIPNQYSGGVIYHGFLSKRNLEQRRRFDKILRQASLFVMPSLYEPFGIAPLEAMAHGIPCVLTDQWAFPEMVVPGINGELVPCGNVEALAHKIQSLLDDIDALKIMGENARRLVIKSYTWEKVVERLIKAITK
jgi:glycosyltransferase involved in cell wall biosynthesis